MSATCGNCKAEVPDNAGYETSRGDVLCTACYFALYGSARLTDRRGGHGDEQPAPPARRRSGANHAGGPFGLPRT